MPEQGTILHTCSEALRKKCKEATEAAKQGNEILGLIHELSEQIKNHLNTIHHEAFQQACEEYPPLADGGNPCQLDFEQGYVYLPKGEPNPAQALAKLMQQIAQGDANGVLVAATSPEELMQKVAALMSGGSPAEDEDEDKVLN